MSTVEKLFAKLKQKEMKQRAEKQSMIELEKTLKEDEEVQKIMSDIKREEELAKLAREQEKAKKDNIGTWINTMERISSRPNIQPKKLNTDVILPFFNVKPKVEEVIEIKPKVEEVIQIKPKVEEVIEIKPRIIETPYKEYPSLLEIIEKDIIKMSPKKGWGDEMMEVDELDKGIDKNECYYCKKHVKDKKIKSILHKKNGPKEIYFCSFKCFENTENKDWK
jgi:hypothetical protein